MSSDDTDRPPKLSSGPAFFTVAVFAWIAAEGHWMIFGWMRTARNESSAGALAFLVLPSLLTTLFALAFWRWVHHELSCVCSYAASDAKVNPERKNEQLHCTEQAVAAASSLAQPNSTHDPAPRPAVAPAGEPDASFLASCEAAGAALDAEMGAAMGNEPLLCAMTLHLSEKFHLRWEPATGKGAADKVEEVPSSFVAAAKALHALAMRYPASDAPLAQGAFAWEFPPLRAGGEVAVTHALHTWVERTNSAAESALFSSMGIWISPYATRCLILWSTYTVYQIYTELLCDTHVIHPATFFAIVIQALGTLASAALLRAGRRESARWAFAATFAVVSVSNLAEAVLSGCKCLGTYATSHTIGCINTRNYPWQWALMNGATALKNVFVAGIATHPRRTFDIVAGVIPFFEILNVVPMALTDPKLFDGIIVGGAMTSALLFGIGTYIFIGRSRALLIARRLADDDAARYVRLWEQLLHPEVFREKLLLLEDAWREVQNGALDVPKRQLDAPSLHALLVQADELNDLLQAKMYDLCTAHGGEHKVCGIKAEARALQKVFRSYGGDWRRLGDLCRTSLVFHDLASMEACLRAIGTDPELQVARVGDAKMRLRESYDAAALSGGYRDIQLCVRLDTAEARARGVATHLCEVQLHFAPIIALKSSGGHKTYVLCRNLSGN